MFEYTRGHSQKETQLKWDRHWKRRETRGLVDNEDNKGMVGDKEDKANEPECRGKQPEQDYRKS